ncbi:ClpXP protease specificity-enhancing factor [Nitrosospira lacus]|uniref:ClpXP protease specificity-enhancing factor n=1 Tax=Nitrosospira lacus TaxID=1288494 RepID=A0A1W6SS49_9PROT|nr:ClpXP protease specificity-enhancing factor [Nitrosospira lacus]ARO88595.1 ClpXP protease specificity-enhancing factor [Nitrosospira lacus]
MKERSTKPYLIRAIYEWCSDSGYTPYLSVKVDAQTRVPTEFVKNGEIILNISFDAAHHLTLGNDLIQFSARFGGLSQEISIPVNAVQGIFAKETTQGILFPPEGEADAVQPENGIENPDKPPSSTQISPAPAGKKRRFQVIK